MYLSRHKVLKVSQGIQYPGELRWELVACLVCAWMLVYFAIWKSIKSSAKVRYFTATLPFLLIIIFLGRSLTLEGADKGLRFFFKPNWALLGDAKVNTLFDNTLHLNSFLLQCNTNRLTFSGLDQCRRSELQFYRNSVWFHDIIC